MSDSGIHNTSRNSLSIMGEKATRSTENVLSPNEFEVFPWNKQLDTGISVIDEQHRKLVEILNRLARQHVSGVDEKEIRKLLDELANYADYHFSTEEKIWKGFFATDEWLLEHEKSHEGFFSKIQVISESQEPFELILEKLFSFLIQWLAFHIIDSDKRMAKAVLACEEGYGIVAAKKRANDEMSGATAVLIQTVLSMYDHLSHQTLELIREKHARQRAEEALSESEARWRLLLEDGDDALWDWCLTEPDDEKGLLRHLAGDKWHLPGNEIDNIKARLIKFVNSRTEDTIQIRYRLQHESGEMHWMKLRCRVIQRDQDSNVVKIIGVRSDESLSELANLIYQHANDAMMIADSGLQVISVNPALENLSGYSKSEVLGTNLRSFLTNRLLK